MDNNNLPANGHGNFSSCTCSIKAIHTLNGGNNYWASSSFNFGSMALAQIL
jgi:hypothetical protein